MPIILGVDAGNSKTLAAVADETGRVLGLGRASGGNHQNKGIDVAIAEIARSIDMALEAAALRRSDVDSTFYALAGADLDEDFALLRPALAALVVGARWEVDNDTMAGLRAGARRRDCVVVIAGSGTNAAGRNHAGESIRLPGLGWISGDWGGGGDLAREAVSLAMRAWDGRGEPTALTAAILDLLALPSMDDVLLALYQEGMRGTRLLDLVPRIFEVAAEGDVVARTLVDRQADEVAATAGALIRRLGLADTPCDVVLAGSVFRDRTGRLVAAVTARLQARYPQADVIVSQLEPVLGSVLCGFDLLGLDTGETVHDTLLSSFADIWAEGARVRSS
jgi:N-acetylglucosamine kinase-like BadF-type ATPase